jgi:hypothetical protein
LDGTGLDETGLDVTELGGTRLDGTALDETREGKSRFSSEQLLGDIKLVRKDDRIKVFFKIYLCWHAVQKK